MDQISVINFIQSNRDGLSDLNARAGIVTRFDLFTVPVHGIWYQVGIYTTDQVPTILDAFGEWQEKGGATDVKSTVALIIGLETTTLGLIYSEHTDKPAAFAPFYNITPATLAVPATNGTVLSITQILGSTFSNAPMRYDSFSCFPSKKRY